MENLIERTEEMIRAKQEAAQKYAESKGLTGVKLDRYFKFINEKEIAPLVELIEAMKNQGDPTPDLSEYENLGDKPKPKSQTSIRRIGYMRGREQARAESIFRAQTKWNF